MFECLFRLFLIILKELNVKLLYNCCRIFPEIKIISRYEDRSLVFY